MRLARLALTAFGPFSGQAIEFADPGSGADGGVVDVIFGPNEAGKSTTLRAIGDLLFGIPHVTPDDHRHRAQDLLLGATLVGPGGERWEIVRSKGRKDTLRTAAGESADERKLSRWLGGIQRDLFTRAYGLDHETLRRGAEELLEGEGDAAELLFSAALGRTGLLALERELREKAEQIFTPRGKLPALNQALKAYKDARSRSDGTDRNAWETQRAELDLLRSEQRALSIERETLVAERTLVYKLLRVLPVAAAVARHARVQAEAIAELEQRLAAIPRDEAIAAVAGRIAAIAERIQPLRRGELDRPGLDRSRAALAAELERIAFGVGSEPRTDRVLAAVTSALEPLESLDAQRRALEARVRESRAEHAVDVRHDPEAEGMLRRALERMRNLGDVAAERRKLERAVQRMEAKLAQLRITLPWEPETRALPLPSSIALHERELEERRSAVVAASAEAASVERELAKKTQQRDQLVAGGAPPTESDVRAARAERDETFLALTRGEDVRPAFEAKLRRADELVDALRAESARAAILATLEADLRALAAARTERETALAAARDGERAALSAWRAVAPVDATPEEVRAFIALHDEIVRLRAALADEEHSLQEHDRATSEARSALARACGSADDPDLVSRADARLAALALGRASAVRLAKDEATLAAANAEYERAREVAQRALGAASLPVDASPREAAALIAKILEGERVRRSLAEVDDRIAQASAERARVDAEVRAIASQLEVPFTDGSGDVLDVAEALVRRHQLEVERGRERASIESELRAKRSAREDEARKLALHRTELAETLAALGDKFEDRGSEEANEGALDARREAIEQEMEAKDDRLRRLGQEIGGKSAGLAQMEATSHAVEASEGAEAERAKIRDLALRYARLRAGAVLLRREMERYREAHEGPVVRHAGELFRHLSGGSFGALRVDHDDGDRPVLLAIRDGGASLDVAALSEGTRDQLYLALRLATLLRTAEATDPLPLVLDDVLVHFDDARARAAFRVLGDVACKMQVILFTHHEHVTALAREALGERAAIHRLG